MGIFNFFRKKEKSINVQPIGILKYHESKIGNTFFTYVENDRINQNYELFIYSEVFKTPVNQIDYYNELIDNWDTIIAGIKEKLQKDKNINPDILSLNILGINEKGKDSYDAALAFSCNDLNFTVTLKKLKIKEIEYS